MRKVAYLIAALAACIVSSCLSQGGIPRTIGFVDDTPDGQRSIGGAAKIVEFDMPDGCSRVNGIMLYGSRYGYPQAPAEDFTVTIAKADGSGAKDVKVPYGTIEWGNKKWYTITFKKPVKIRGKFLVAVDFNAQPTKGVYVSYDTSSGNAHSYVGSVTSKNLSEYGGEWMIKAMV